MNKEIDDNLIVQLHNQGLLHKEIAEIIGCKTCTITKHLNMLGIRTYTIDKHEVERLHLLGLEDAEIADLLGCSRANITICLNKLGYTNRHSKVDKIELREKISNKLLGRFVGDKNPNYKGHTDEKTIARGLFKTISKRLLRSKNFNCEICGKHGGNLEVHHIKPFHVIMDEFLLNYYNGDINSIYSQLMSYHDFIDESNLIVLCQNCHRQIHYSDNPELNPYRWESATTIESIS